MTSAGLTLGSIVAVSLIGIFPLTLGALPDTPDLQVAVPGPRPYAVRASADEAAPGPTVYPSPSPEGLTDSHSSPGTGLDLRTWQVTYSHRWGREVTLPTLTGPFVPEGDELCGIALTIGAGLFDTSAAGSGLQDILKGKIGDSLPYTYTHPQYTQVRVTFPKPKVTTMRIGLVAGRLVFFVHLVLEDDTVLDALFGSRLIDENGSPALVRDGPLLHNWQGPTLDALLRQAAEVGANVGVEEHPILSFFFEDAVRAEGARVGQDLAQSQGNAEAGRKLTELVDSALREISVGLANLRGPHHPVATNPTAAVALRLAGSPIVSSKGIVLQVCATTTVADKIDRGVPGSLKTMSGSPVHAAPPSGDATVTLSADGDTMNRVLYFLWQSGALREAGTSTSLVRAALEDATEPGEKESVLSKLAFDFTGFDPGLPPTLERDPVHPNALGFVLGDVKIGEWDDRRVVVHAVGSLDIQTQEDALRLSAKLSQLTADCTRLDGTTTALSPCVSDIMPTARERLLQRPLAMNFNGGDLLGKLPTMSFGGGHMLLSNLRAAMATNPTRLTVQVRAKIQGGL